MLLKTTKLKKKAKKITKSQKTQNLHWGDGELARKSLLKLVFFITRLQNLIEKCRLVLIPNKPKGLQSTTIMTTEDGETPGGFRMAQKSLFGEHLLLFLDGTDKKKQYLLSVRFLKTL